METYAKHRQYINEGIAGSPLISFAGSLLSLEAALVKTGSSQADVKKAAEAADKQRAAFLEDENSALWQRLQKCFMKMWRKNSNQLVFSVL